MKIDIFATAAALLMPVAAMSADIARPVAVSNTRFWQDRTTQKVHVQYELDNEGEPAWVTMDVLTNGVSIGMQHVKTVSGDISQRGLDVLAGGAVADDGALKTIVWSARKDWPGNIGSNAVVEVTAWYTNFLPDVYMVVDLSGGPSAESYPVTLKRAVPDPSDASCAHSQLWLRYIPAGTFEMGAQPGDAGHSYDNSTTARESLHRVTHTKAFYAGVFEVTRGQYSLVLGEDGGTSSGDPLLPVNGKNLNELWGEGFDPSESNDVAEATFFHVLRAKTGLLFTLPTDAQWEYACRAGTTTPYNVDTNFVELTSIAWYKANASGTLHPVGQKAPNNWGLYDMHGSVSEICRDILIHSLGTSHVTDPLITKTMSNGSLGYVVRGGYFYFEPELIRSPCRQWRAPDNTSLIVRDGIRVFLTLE